MLTIRGRCADPRVEKNSKKRKSSQIRFNGSVSLIGMVTTFQYVVKMVRIAKTF
jgi:hypothetical protein